MERKPCRSGAGSWPPDIHLFPKSPSES
jgi:hypothetical protein